MRIVLAASEAVPFSKTGGLADVLPALAVALDRLGHEVTLFIPDHRQVRQQSRQVVPAVMNSGLQFEVPVGAKTVRGGVHWSMLPDSDVKVVLVDQPEYFDRPGIYQHNNRDFSDNCERFCFFSRAVLELCRQMTLRPHVINCNDWQTGLIPALLKTHYSDIPGLAGAASVMTIHNLAYQGQFWHLDMELTGMDWKYFTWEAMEAHGGLNLMKTGIVFADRLTTVSPTYAREICTEEFGHGLHGLLSHRSAALTGILNGIDVDYWNPATDATLPRTYSVDDWQDGKAECKAHLQRRMGLPQKPDAMLCGIVSRLAEQKGFDILMDAIDRILRHDVQMAILGSGERRYETQLRDLAVHFPQQVGIQLGYDESLAHQIEAGSDVFLMPSRFEPCGLNQMYSQRYGTLPIVRRVGGLADSVVNLDMKSRTTGTATGFCFDEYSPSALAEAVERAFATFKSDAAWKQMVPRAMSLNWTWEASAKRYVEVYENAIAAAGEN